MKRLSIALAGVLTLALGAVVVPPAQAATCDPNTLVLGSVDFSAPYDSVDEGMPGYIHIKFDNPNPACTIYNVNAYVKFGPSLQTVPLSYSDDMTWGSGYHGSFVPVEYGKGSFYQINAYYGDPNPSWYEHNLNSPYEFYYRTEHIDLTDPGPLVIQKGNIVPLNGALISEAMRSVDKVDLEVRKLGTQSWQEVASTPAGTKTNGAFQFNYQPTEPVEYRYAYDQTDWAYGIYSNTSTINFVAPPPAWSATVTVPNFTWTQHSCERVPALISITKTGGHWNVDMDVKPDGSGNDSGWLFAYGDQNSLTNQTETFQLCPSDTPNGPYTATGKIQTNSNGDTPVSAKFTVSPMPSAVSVHGVTKNAVTGRATSTSATLGVIGAREGNAVKLQALVNGTWSDLNWSHPDTLGNFTIWYDQTLGGGTPMRVVYEGGSTSAAATSAQFAYPAPPPPPVKKASVYVAAVSKAGKLYVNVNPDKGKGYWKFRVQKLSGTKWVNKAVYKTKGSKETRTINLKKGTYRVVVYPKYGYQGTTSGAIYLKK